MIEFATFFLGLVAGAHNLDLVVGPDVARVEIRLDDRKLEELRSSPWRTIVDFGPGLEPHELVAVAYDAKSREMGRARQWVNRPRAQAEAALVLEGGAGGRGRRARVTWHSISGPEPKKWLVAFDGKPLLVASPRDFELPPHIPEQVHFLRVELDFAENVSTVAEVVFGGRNKDETLTELTAVPVLLTTARKLPALAALEGCFADGAEKVRVVAAEEGPAEIVFVLDGSADNALQGMGLTGVRGLRGRPGGRDDMVLRRDQRFRVLWPVPERREHSGMVHQVFPSSEDLKSEDGGVLALLNGVRRYASVRDQKLADAVAVAGVSATGRNRRRAVVLILGPEPNDGSDLPAREARLYLERLGVPLSVWSVAPPATRPKTPEWGVPTDVSARHLFADAVDRLSAAVERQRIVWVEGRHLPQRIAVCDVSQFVPLTRNWKPASEPEPRAPAPPPAPVAPGLVEAAEEVLIPAGSRLRSEPDSFAITLAVVDDDLTLPILERRGKWVRVRYESWKGWVEPGSDAGPATPLGPGTPQAEEDLGEELRRARFMMPPAATQFHHLLAGRLDLLTDVRKAGSLDDLAGVTRRFAMAFAERYGIAMGARIKWTVAFFDLEATCSAFRGLEPDGPAARPLAVVCRGSRPPEVVRRELAQEMARIAVHTKIALNSPPWLDEGLAADFAAKESPDTGAAVRLVRAEALAGRRPPVTALMASPRKAFFAAGAREPNVALAGLLVRYFLEGDDGAYAVAFREFLDAVSHGDSPRSDELLSKLGVDRDGLEKSFTAWLGSAK